MSDSDSDELEDELRDRMMSGPGDLPLDAVRAYHIIGGACPECRAPVEYLIHGPLEDGDEAVYEGEDGAGWHMWACCGRCMVRWGPLFSDSALYEDLAYRLNAIKEIASYQVVKDAGLPAWATPEELLRPPPAPPDPRQLDLF